MNSQIDSETVPVFSFTQMLFMDDQMLSMVRELEDYSVGNMAEKTGYAQPTCTKLERGEFCNGVGLRDEYVRNLHICAEDIRTLSLMALDYFRYLTENSAWGWQIWNISQNLTEVPDKQLKKLSKQCIMFAMRLAGVITLANHLNLDIQPLLKKEHIGRYYEISHQYIQDSKKFFQQLGELKITNQLSQVLHLENLWKLIIYYKRNLDNKRKQVVRLLKEMEEKKHE